MIFGCCGKATRVLESLRRLSWCSNGRDGVEKSRDGIEHETEVTRRKSLSEDSAI